MSAKFQKIGANFSAGIKFVWIFNFVSRLSVPTTILIISMFDLHKCQRSAKFHKSWNTLQFWDQICPISSQDPQFSNIIFTINKLALSAKLRSIGNIFHFWDQIFLEWGIDTCFNVTCVSIGRNFGFLMVTGGYCSLPLVTACSHF